MPLRGLVLLLFFAGSVPVCFFRPFYGIMLWVVVAFLNPQSYTWSAFDAFPWALAVAIPTILGMLLFDRRFGRLASFQVAMLGVLWIWFTITTVISTSTPEFAHHADTTWFKWRFVSKILLMTACMIPIVSSFERLRYLVLTIAGCFGFYVLKSIPFVIATGGVFRLYGPERSMVADNNDFGLALNMTLPMYFCLAQTESHRWVRRLFALLFVLTIPAILFTYSRGAMVGLVAVLIVMLLQAKRRIALVPVIALGIVIALYFAPVAWKERMDPTRPAALDVSAQGRLIAWTFARALAADYPITGGGFDTFTQELFNRYDVRMKEVGPHSVYFQVLAEHGYVGLGIYLALVASCFTAARRLRKTARLQGHADIANYAQMFQFSLVGFLTSGAFVGRAYFDYFFLVVACLTILSKAAADRRSTQVVLTGQSSVTAPSPVMAS